MDMRSLIIIIGAMLGALTSANAADFALKASTPVVPQSNNWTGMYIGGFAGGSWVDGIYSPFGSNIGFHESGFIGGLYLGYDYELPNRFVFGARVSAPLGAVSKSSPVPIIPGDTVSADFQWAAAANLIFGYDMGVWMPFIGVGAIYADNKATFSVPGGSASDSQMHPGLNVLAGIKYALTRNWAIGAQYNHSIFANESYNFTAPALTTGTANFSQDSVVATLEYRFQ